jgi:DNA polymerase III epsilon subunit-like protein
VRPTLTCKVVWWQWGQVIISTVYLAPTTLATPNISLLRRPGKKNLSAFDIHGIDEDMLKDAPMMDDAALLNLLSEYMNKKAWAAFNVDFDERMIYQGMGAVGDNSGFPESRGTFCVQKLMNRYLGHEYTSLNQACRTLDIPRSTKHRAATNAEDTLKVLLALAAKVPAERSIQPDPF